MATNVADLFAQAVATQMPNVFYIAPPERGAVATYGNPFDSSKYDTGTGRNTIPSWMVDNKSGGDGNGGLGSNGPMPHVFLPRNPPEPRVGPDEGPAYVQATNDDPFQGVTPTVRTVDQQTGEAITRDAGASGRGDSVQTPLNPGWIAPEFIRGNPDRSAPDPSGGYTQEELAAIANAPGTQYNPDGFDRFMQIVDAQAAGGAIADWSRILTDAVIDIVTPSPFSVGGNLAFKAFEDPLIATAAATGAQALESNFKDSPLNPWSWPDRLTAEVWGGVGPGDKVPNPEDYAPNTDITYDIGRVPGPPVVTDTNEPDVLIPAEMDTEGNVMSWTMPEFRAQEEVREIADTWMPMTDLGSISINGGLDDSTLTDAEREAFEAYILGAQKGKG